MGSPMAQHLLAAQHEMFIRTRSKVPAELASAHVCATNADVARAADIIFLMLPDTPDVEAVLFGKDGVAEGLSQGKIVVDMSSISPMDTKTFAQKSMPSVASTSMPPSQAAKWAPKQPASPSWWAAQKPPSTPSSLCLN